MFTLQPGDSVDSAVENERRGYVEAERVLFRTKVEARLPVFLEALHRRVMLGPMFELLGRLSVHG